MHSLKHCLQGSRRATRRSPSSAMKNECVFKCLQWGDEKSKNRVDRRWMGDGMICVYNEVAELGDDRSATKWVFTMKSFDKAIAKQSDRRGGCEIHKFTPPRRRRWATIAGPNDSIVNTHDFSSHRRMTKWKIVSDDCSIVNANF